MQVFFQWGYSTCTSSSQAIVVYVFRLYFGEHNVPGMFATLDPLHQKMEDGPETLKEISFNHVRFAVDMHCVCALCASVCNTCVCTVNRKFHLGLIFIKFVSMSVLNMKKNTKNFECSKTLREP